MFETKHENVCKKPDTQLFRRYFGENLRAALFSVSFGLHNAKLLPVNTHEQEDDAQNDRLQELWDENNEREQEWRTPAYTLPLQNPASVEEVSEEENMKRQDQASDHVERYHKKRRSRKRRRTFSFGCGKWFLFLDIESQTVGAIFFDFWFIF